MASEFKLSVNSDMASLTTISEFIHSAARELGLDDDQTFAVHVAVDEACCNIIEHGYSGRMDGTIDIICRLSGNNVVVTIRDTAPPFDPEAVPEPNVSAPLEECAGSGLGLFLMKKLMDSVEFEFDAVRGNLLIMRKKRDCAEAPP
jgi:anti-sigma regulatory factor (Ser/Thr protein kinase)